MARSKLPQGESLAHCEECDAKIPEARQKAIVGVRRCVNCQSELDKEQAKKVAITVGVVKVVNYDRN